MKKVYSQEEFEQALRDGETQFEIVGFRAVALGNANVVAGGNANVVALGNANVVAGGNANVVAGGNANVVARENAKVEAWGNANVEARENANVEAWENANVVAWGNAKVVAWGNAKVVARENVKVVAGGNANVVARENVKVVARGNANVVARENANVNLFDFSVAYYYPGCFIPKLISNRATAILVNYPSGMREWCALKGIKIKNGRARFWKAINKDGKDFYSQKINYLVQNKNIVDPNWEDPFREECGSGLHLADSKSGALSFLSRGSEYILILVSAAIADCRCWAGQPKYPQKIRAKQCRFVREIERGVK